MTAASTPAVIFEGVGVSYRMPEERGITSFKEWMIKRLTSGVKVRTVNALRDISFAVPEGQTVGIIGSNGAGKSTLLRVAAGIITPSAGCAEMRGRLAPIIELGTGFEHELTGRENIFFNGALLGRSRREMEERLDEIVDFAELRPFIDSPLRTYSTGMVARLAFSIATTVDAKVLLLDEILSVGDESFRTRCNERIDEFRSSRVTILLVSHDLSAVERLCDRVLWIDHGLLLADGRPEDVLPRYRAAVAAAQEEPPGGGVHGLQVGAAVHREGEVVPR